VSSPIWDQNHQVDYLRPRFFQIEALGRKESKNFTGAYAAKWQTKFSNISSPQFCQLQLVASGLADPFKFLRTKVAFVESHPSSYLSWLHDSNSFFHLIQALFAKKMTTAHVDANCSVTPLFKRALEQEI